MIYVMQCIKSFISNNNHGVTLPLRQSYGGTNTPFSNGTVTPPSIHIIIFFFLCPLFSHKIMRGSFYLLAVGVDSLLSSLSLFHTSSLWSLLFILDPEMGHHTYSTRVIEPALLMAHIYIPPRTRDKSIRLISISLT